MVMIDLTEEEKKRIIEALNSNTEPTPELMAKLCPRLAEKFDVAKLDRAKVVTLEYAGKRSEGAVFVTGRTHSTSGMTSINYAWKHVRSQNVTLKPPPDPPRKPIGFEVKEGKAKYGKK